MFPKLPTGALKNMKAMADVFQLERDGKIICEKVTAFFCGKDYPDTIQVVGDEYDIREEDVMIHVKTNRRNFIDNVRPTHSGFMVHYQTEYQRKKNLNQSVGISIGSIGGNAIVGSQQFATINIGTSFDEVRKFIDGSQDIPNADKAELQKFIDAVQTVVENNIPVAGGTFSKFSNLVERYAPIVGSILHPLTAWILGK